MYTAIKQVDPNGVLFQFPDTELGFNKGVYSLPNYKVISYVKTGEIVADKTTTSRIFIALTKDMPYNLTPDKEALIVSFPKDSSISKSAKPQKQITAKKHEPKPIEKKVPAPKPIQKKSPGATLLKAVTTKSHSNRIVVDVEADGAIKDYKSFTMKNPALIVLDIPNVKSLYKTEQKMAIDSKWVKQIRYFGHPDKLRLVLETYRYYLSKYSINPTETGLMIQVGKIPVVPVKAKQTNKGKKSGTKQVKLAWDKVPNAISYNVYLSNSPGVTKQNGLKISNVKNPYVTTDLKRGATYYFVVTAVNESGESKESKEISFTVGE